MNSEGSQFTELQVPVNGRSGDSEARDHLSDVNGERSIAGGLGQAGHSRHQIPTASSRVTEIDPGTIEVARTFWPLACWPVTAWAS